MEVKASFHGSEDSFLEPGNRRSLIKRTRPNASVEVMKALSYILTVEVMDVKTTSMEVKISAMAADKRYFEISVRQIALVEVEEALLYGSQRSKEHFFNGSEDQFHGS